MHTTAQQDAERGFSLIETMIAIVILTVGILSLAAMLAAGITQIYSSQSDFIAQEKAQEAVESIFTARDSGLSWASIANTADGGIFLPGPLQLCDPGPDGIVGTADDNCGLPDCIQTPGPDGILGTADDVCYPLNTFTRTIAITLNANGNPSLNLITVTMNYRAGQLKKQYVLQAYISSAF